MEEDYELQSSPRSLRLITYVKESGTAYLTPRSLPRSDQKLQLVSGLLWGHESMIQTRSVFRFSQYSGYAQKFSMAVCQAVLPNKSLMIQESVKKKTQRYHIKLTSRGQESLYPSSFRRSKIILNSKCSSLNLLTRFGRTSFSFLGIWIGSLLSSKK